VIILKSPPTTHIWILIESPIRFNSSKKFLFRLGIFRPYTLVIYISSYVLIHLNLRVMCMALEYNSFISMRLGSQRVVIPPEVPSTSIHIVSLPGQILWVIPPMLLFSHFVSWKIISAFILDILDFSIPYLDKLFIPLIFQDVIIILNILFGDEVIVREREHLSWVHHLSSFFFYFLAIGFFASSFLTSWLFLGGFKGAGIHTHTYIWHWCGLCGLSFTFYKFYLIL